MSGFFHSNSSHGISQEFDHISEEESDCFSEGSSNVGGDSTCQSKKSLEDEITKNESVAVLRLRQVVILILVGITLTVSFVIYLVRKSGEAQQFSIQYDATSEKIVES